MLQRRATVSPRLLMIVFAYEYHSLLPQQCTQLLLDNIQPLDNLDEGEEHGALGHARGGVHGPGIAVLSCCVEDSVQCLAVFGSERASDLHPALFLYVDCLSEGANGPAHVDQYAVAMRARKAPLGSDSMILLGTVGKLCQVVRIAETWRPCGLVFVTYPQLRNSPLLPRLPVGSPPYSMQSSLVPVWQQASGRQSSTGNRWHGVSLPDSGDCTEYLRQSRLGREIWQLLTGVMK